MDEIGSLPRVRIRLIERPLRRNKLGSNDLLRLLQGIDLNRAGGRLALAFKGLRADGQRNGLVGSLPWIRRDGCLQGGVPCADHPLVRPRLSRRIGHIGVDNELEYRLILLRHSHVRFGGELDRKRTV